MKEYKVFFQPTFHDHVNLCLETDEDFAILSLASPPSANRIKAFSFAREVSRELIEDFTREISAVDPLTINSIKDVGRDGISIDCFYSDSKHSNQFYVWSPTGEEYREQLVFINSLYRLACRVFTDEQPARLLKNLNAGRYFG